MSGPGWWAIVAWRAKKAEHPTYKTIKLRPLAPTLTVVSTYGAFCPSMNPKVQTPPSAEAVFALGADSGLRISDLLTQTMCFKSLQIWYLELIEPVEEVVLEMPRNSHNYQIMT